MYLCSFCYNVFKRTNEVVKTNPESRKKINDFLREDVEEPYNGEVKALHLLEVLRDNIGFDKIKDIVKKKFMYRNMRKHYNKIKSKGVKQAPFYVLLGAQMPCILIETAFISNPRECKRLNNLKYQDRLCDAIIKGIQQYIKEINPTALIEDKPGTGTQG